MTVVKAGDRTEVRWKANANLAGASVELFAELRGTTVPIPLNVTVVDAADGLVAHALDGTLPVGTYRIELKVRRGADDPVTFPTEGTTVLEVKRAIA